jgi:hypothetical protein
MHFADDVQSLYTAAAQHLRVSDKPKLEALKLRVARAKIYDNPITHLGLAELLNVSQEEADARFDDLRAAGFIESHFTHFAWVRFDPINRARSLAALGMIEANVALRCRYLDMEPMAPALDTLAAEIVAHSAKSDLLEVCLTAQRLFLALVAGMNAPDLFREYAALAKAGLTYAWSASLHDGVAAEFSHKMVGVVSALKRRDGVSAAKGITHLRSLSDKAVLAVPLSS